ncbi:iron chelate uptake ABC transporter family permease subunit [Caldibacillus debilis]|jgi:iron complex transport system permease protein|uniref:ABC-type enterochelin transport system, permease component n=1 Tax=Caldibacillus debilis GB1 TaxID=1339248 RepID=A0A420VHQ2_9BACI|nr:iron chelate uptake ABC transporter family permease subunit [Caldibacillus debilis]RKO63107.1 ABC-type enterochelin transport system, permease component [Caldibacillus debilis GB1]
MKRLKGKIWLLVFLAVLFIALFLFSGLSGNISYILPRRAMKIAAIILTGAAVAFSTVVFQTITQNRILTPSIMGLDDLYMLLNTAIIFLFGSTRLTMMDRNIQFLLNAGIMILFSVLMYHFLFKKEQNIYFLLLIGFVVGTFFESFSSFMQVLIDPNEFQIVQDRMFASFNNLNIDVLYLASALFAAAALFFVRDLKYLDVMALGRDHAINLGVDFDVAARRFMVIVAVLTSISTALAGPVTFLGLLVANLSYEYLKTYRHRELILGAILISIIALVGGQWIVERVFAFSTTLSVIINFIGGIYFIYLLLKENRSW